MYVLHAPGRVGAGRGQDSFDLAVPASRAIWPFQPLASRSLRGFSM